MIKVKKELRLWRKVFISLILKVDMVANTKHIGVNSGSKIMISAQSVASYFIEQSSKTSENDLTNLKLQKILFYTQAESLHDTGEPIFSESIEAWKYGPVVPSVYEWLKGCGAYPITAFDVTTDTSDIDAGQEAFLKRIWDNYSKYSAGYLVSKTHEDNSPWSRVYSESRNNVIEVGNVKEARLQSAW